MSYLNIVNEMANYEKEIKDNKENYEKLRLHIMSILGDTEYKALYAFFYKLLTNEDLKYLIIMSRRCLVLCQIFVIFMILDGIELCKKVIVLSDKAIPIYGNKLCGKIGIVDDILIHGRTISSVCKLIEKYNAKPEIEIFGYRKDIALDCLPDYLREKTHVEREDYKSEWRNLSNKIVKCIYASNVPYTSFVTSFFQYNSKNVLEALDEITELKMINNTAEAQRNEGLYSYYYYEENSTFLKQISFANGIRVYWSESVQKLTIIPYVFMKKLSIEDAKQLFKNVAQIIPERYTEIHNILKKKDSDDTDIDDALMAYQMRLLTSLFSKLYWLKFTKKYNLDQIYSTNIDTLEKSFGPEVAKELVDINLEDVSDLFTIEWIPQPTTEIIEASVEKNWKASGAGCDKEKLRRYFQKAWYEDEIKALRNEERSKGISLDYCLKELDEQKDNKQEILAILVNIWDMGIAAANYAIDEGRNCIACYNTSGEQSYRLILENYPSVFFYLIAVSKILRKGDIKGELSFEEYRKRVLLDLLKELDTDQSIQGYNDIKDIIELEKGYLNAWNQVNIINNAMKSDSRKNQKELVINFINNIEV